MPSYNLCILMGNLARDVSLKYLPSGTPVAEFTLGINEKFKDKDGNAKEEVYWANITVFGKQAEHCSTYLRKGSLALVQGKITEQRWEKDGEKKSKTVIVAHQVKFLSMKKEEEGSGPPEEHTEREPF